MASNVQQRQRILLDWLIIILFLLFIFLPEINRQFLIIPDISSTEKRTLASRPLFDIRKIDDFIKKFDLFYNDNFGFRVRLVAANTRLHVNLFGISGVPRVIIGKHGWLFINDYPPTDPRAFSSWQGYNPYSLDELVAIQKNLEAENKWFTQQNITFLILPSPDKHSIYSEYLPWQYNTIVGPSRQAQIFEHMKLHSNLQLVDVRQALLTAKKVHGLDTYFKTDSHWNTIGAFFAYEEVMKRLLIIYPQFVAHRFEDFVADRKLKQVGDLARMANLDMSHILEHQLVPKQNATFYSMGPKKDKILFYGDSFSDLFLKHYFRRHFKDVKFSSGALTAKSQITKHIVLHYRPDVVIFESVERYWTNV
ncbi:unnamed protein product [Rotaria sp. Silwood1]|nr:unnamed protein product [Rotaria sp. Silwood1]